MSPVEVNIQASRRGGCGNCLDLRDRPTFRHVSLPIGGERHPRDQPPTTSQLSDSKSSWIPWAIAGLSVLTLAMIVVALGVMFDFLPGLATEFGEAGDARRSLAHRLLPIGSSIIGVSFVAAILRRYFQKGGTHLLIWGIGLAFFATGSITESLHGLIGWSPTGFRFWYLFGAVLIAAWMGQGTTYLLASKRTARWTGMVLLVCSVFATYKVFTADLDPRMIARGVESVTPFGGASQTDVLRAAAVLHTRPAVTETGELDPRKFSPLARNLAETLVGGSGQGGSGQGANLSDVELSGEVEQEQRGVRVSGTVDGRNVVVGDREWLHRHGVETDDATTDAKGHDMALFVAIDGRPAGRIQLLEASVLSGHVITSPGVRVLTPFFNIYGIIMLIGGALYSAWIFWRKGVFRNRAIGNVLIAAGAVLGGGASAFARFGMLEYLYLAELSSLIIMFAGFVVATKREPEKS